jgi:2'-5' RNA ligase
MSALYFIAIVPPEPIVSEVYSLKKEMADRYNSYRSLRNPPHITLLPPTTGTLDWENKIKTTLEHFAGRISPFRLILDGFASFPNKKRKNPVIYVHNEESPELEKLFRDLIAELRIKEVISEKQIPQRFSPHMTIGYRDLTLENFDKAWAEFQTRTYHAAFLVDSVCLLKHDTKEAKWNILSHFRFGVT